MCAGSPIHVAPWAIQKACELSGWRDWAQLKCSHPGPKAMVPKAVLALARYIAAHEKAPPITSALDTALRRAFDTGFLDAARNELFYSELRKWLAEPPQ